MKSKEILLWVVAIGALVISLVAVIGPKGLKSDAAQMQYTVDQGQSSGVLNAKDTVACLKQARTKARTCLDNAVTQDAEDACWEEYNVQKFICRNQNNVPIENQN